MDDGFCIKGLTKRKGRVPHSHDLQHLKYLSLWADSKEERVPDPCPKPLISIWLGIYILLYILKALDNIFKVLSIYYFYIKYVCYELEKL